MMVMCCDGSEAEPSGGAEVAMLKSPVSASVVVVSVRMQCSLEATRVFESNSIAQSTRSDVCCDLSARSVGRDASDNRVRRPVCTEQD